MLRAVNRSISPAAPAASSAIASIQTMAAGMPIIGPSTGNLVRRGKGRWRPVTSADPSERGETDY